MRIALVGCGMIGTTHARAIASSPIARCTALFDAAPDRAKSFQDIFFPEARVARAVEELPGLADAAIVAVPAALHAPLSIALFEAGLHVLCEKPLATTLEDAEAMAEAARRASRVLVCGLQRGFAGTTQLVHDVLRHDLVGAPRHVEFWESVSDWPLPKTSFDRRLAGGGAFFDVAPHILDLLAGWFGAVEVLRYEDDAVRGVESVGRAELACSGAHGAVTATVLLARGFRASNRCRITCARGSIEIGGGDRDALKLTFADAPRAHAFKSWVAPRDAFDAQLEHFVRAARGEHAPVPIAAAVRTVALVEECYRVREPLRSLYAGHHSVGPSPELPYRKVLLTGATGQIGTRLVEMWAARGDLGRLRCLLHSYRNAGPILRFPAEVVEGDLFDPAALARAAAGCDAIVHLGLGTRASEEVEPLLRVARETGIRRFVHMSSATVYGRTMPAFIERLQEDTPLRKIGEPYADAKVGAEKAVLLAAKHGLDAVILRPHIVYGPAQRWSTIMADLLRSDAFAVIEDAGWCNLVYVDDLVGAVDRALVSSDAVGRSFFVTDGEPRTWREFIHAHARLLGANPPRVTAAEVRPRRFDEARRLVGRLRALVGSSQVRSLVLDTPPIAAAIVPLYQAMKRTGPFGAYVARQRPPGAPSGPDPRAHEWTALQLMDARLSCARAETILGYRARVPFEEGMERTASWLAFFGHTDPAAAAGDRGPGPRVATIVVSP